LAFLIIANFIFLGSIHITALIIGAFTDERIVNIYLKKGTFPINPIKNAKVLSETKDEIEIILQDEEKERNLTIRKDIVEAIEDLENIEKFC